MNENKNADITVEKPQKRIIGRPFEKGNKANPNGRPKGTAYIDQLNEAIRIVETDKKKKLFTRFVEQAYANPSIMIALMNKLLANQQHTEIEGIEPIEIIHIYDKD